MSDKQATPITTKLFYTSALLYIMLYFFDWILGIKNDLLSIIWGLITAAIFGFTLVYLRYITTHTKKFFLSCGLVSLFILGYYFEDEIKNLTLGEIVFHMEDNDISSTKFIIRKQKTSLKAYYSSSFFGTTIYKRFDASVDDKNILFTNTSSSFSVTCTRDECKSEVHSYYIYVDRLLFFTPDRG